MCLFLQLHNEVDCQWSEWTFGHCSQTCGTGELLKIRSKTAVEVHDGSCTGTVNETESCNTNNCPGNTFYIMRVSKFQ